MKTVNKHLVKSNDSMHKYPAMSICKDDIVSRINARLDRPLVLIGLMGAGKTRLGRQLSKKLGLKFFDSDDEIEKAAAMKISDIFEKYGEPYFRDGEKRVVERLLKKPPCVIATGGGAIMNPATQKLVEEKAFSIWIKPDIDTLVERTSRRNTRPLLKNGDPREILKKLSAERQSVYERANMILDEKKTSGKTALSASLNMLDNFLQERS